MPIEGQDPKIKALADGILPPQPPLKCRLCRRQVGPFRDDLSVREHSISGFCQHCQDNCFADLDLVEEDFDRRWHLTNVRSDLTGDLAPPPRPTGKEREAFLIEWAQDPKTPADVQLYVASELYLIAYGVKR